MLEFQKRDPLPARPTQPDPSYAMDWAWRQSDPAPPARGPVITGATLDEHLRLQATVRRYEERLAALEGRPALCTRCSHPIGAAP